jgi:hypothetical protein
LTTRDIRLHSAGKIGMLDDVEKGGSVKISSVAFTMARACGSFRAFIPGLHRRSP